MLFLMNLIINEYYIWFKAGTNFNVHSAKFSIIAALESSDISSKHNDVLGRKRVTNPFVHFIL